MGNYIVNVICTLFGALSLEPFGILSWLSVSPPLFPYLGDIVAGFYRKSTRKIGDFVIDFCGDWDIEWGKYEC